MIISQKTKLAEARAVVQKAIPAKPDVFIILGSGLGEFTKNLQEPVVIEYGQIPNFLVSTVPGHAGRLVCGYLGDKYVVAMQGRFHYYEGYSLPDVTFPVKVMRGLGAETLIVTNASGIINQNFAPSQLMLITDHLNLLGDNPLIGLNDATMGERFPDMSNVYAESLQNLALATAKELAITLQTGVYAAATGPSYETPAEVRYLRIIGADAVGMSTVPEAIVGKYCGMKVLGISCLTNYAAGMTNNLLNHEEVIENAAKASQDFTNLLLNIIPKL